MSPRPAAEDEDGAVAVMAGLMALMLFTLAALVVQFGFSRDVRSASQNASDASALAAAYVVNNSAPAPNFSAAVTAAITYAAVNFQVDPSEWDVGKCLDPGALAYRTSTTNCVSFDSSTAPTKVRVVMPTRETVTAVGAGAGANSVTIGSVAEAAIALPSNVTCGLCILGDVSTNTSDFTVTAGSIAVNGNISANSASYWQALDGKIQVAGQVNGDEPSQVTSSSFNPRPVKTAPFTDPYASMGMPTGDGLPDRSSTTTCNGTILPGVYGNISLGNNDTCTLSPGLYVITGLWEEKNGSVITGAGVTLYFTCGSPAAVRPCTQSTTAGTGGRLDAKNGSLPITSGASGYEKFALMYDRFNPNAIQVQGNGGTQISGAIYAVRATMTFNGSSAFGVTKGPVVVQGVAGVGNFSGLSVSNSQDVTISSTPGSVNLSR